MSCFPAETKKGLLQNRNSCKKSRNSWQGMCEGGGLGVNCRAAAREGGLGRHGSNHPPAGENSARSCRLLAEFQGGVAFCNASLFS